MGGKARTGKRIVQAILDDTLHRERWFEPFMGGGNVLEHAAPHFGRSVGMDAHQDLVLMWQAVTDGWVPPEATETMYRELRNSEPSALRGYIGFVPSFGGKWFGGYSGDHNHPTRGPDPFWKVGRRSIVRQAGVFAAHGVRFRCRLFGEYTPRPGTVVYCDPPYAGTTGYSTGEFDYPVFYKTLAQWASNGCSVYVSEYAVPDGVDATVIWQHERQSALKSDDNSRKAVEKLFRIGGGR